jgi:single-strand DNA-binding protein
MSNEASFSVAGYVATQPVYRLTKSGVPTLSMRLAWTPRRYDRASEQWADEPSCFVTVQCYRRVAENARFSLYKGDPVVVSGTLRIRDYDAKDGSRRTNIDITAATIGHDLTRGVTAFRRLRPPTEREADLLAARPAGPAEGDPGDSERDDVDPADLDPADPDGDYADPSDADHGGLDRSDADHGDAGQGDTGDGDADHGDDDSGEAGAADADQAVAGQLQAAGS